MAIATPFFASLQWMPTVFSLYSLNATTAAATYALWTPWMAMTNEWLDDNKYAPPPTARTPVVVRLTIFAARCCSYERYTCSGDLSLGCIGKLVHHATYSDWRSGYADGSTELRFIDSLSDSILAAEDSRLYPA